MSMIKLVKFGAMALSIGVAASAVQAGEGAMGGMDQGGMEGMSMDSMAPEEELTFGEAGKAADVSRTITVTIENAAYDVGKLTVKDGETIRFVIINKDDVEHEFTLGTAEMQAADRAKMMKQMDMGQSMVMTEPNAVSVASLETKELIWKFKGPGEIEFDCNVPGHYETGMTGTITITK